MNVKKVFGLSMTALLLSMGIIADVNADNRVETKCRVRQGLRSKISVDGEGMVGTFYAEVRSGGVVIKSAPQEADADREVEFDFDSNANDIDEGATAIPFNFIKGRRVLGSIFKTTDNGSTGTLVEDDRAICKFRKKK